jgi:acid phosphatase type 7
MKALALTLVLLVFSLAAWAHPASAPQLRHWETASADPDRIFLSFMGDVATRRAVTWRTDTTVEKAYAQIAPALAEPRFDRHARTLAATTTALDLNQSRRNTQGVVHYHSVVFEDLRPDTLYAYRVGDGERHWSEWLQFRTSRADAAPFSFLYFGDAQNDILSHWSRVIRMAAQKAPEALLALHAGDLVNRSHDDREWAEWFKAGGWLHAQWTGMPVTGNHEYDPLIESEIEEEASEDILALTWRAQFALPAEEALPEVLQGTVYTVEHQGVQIIVLNSNLEIEAQVPYLERQLQKPGPRWRVVSFHHPLFSPGGDRDSPERRAAWKPVLDRYGADLVLQGHDHTYARGHVPVRTAKGYVEGTVQTMYVTSVSGPKMYEIRPGKLEAYAGEGLVPTRQAENTQFFQVIRVDGNELRYQAYTATGELYDQATLRKDFKTGKKTLIQQVPDLPTRTQANTETYER